MRQTLKSIGYLNDYSNLIECLKLVSKKANKKKMTINRHQCILGQRPHLTKLNKLKCSLLSSAVIFELHPPLKLWMPLIKHLFTCSHWMNILYELKLIEKKGIGPDGVSVNTKKLCCASTSIFIESRKKMELLKLYLCSNLRRSCISKRIGRQGSRSHYNDNYRLKA